MAARPLLYLYKEFQSYDEFEKCFAEYQESTQSVFTIKSSKTVVNRNLTLCAKGEAPYKEDLKYTNVEFRCKRGGPKRIRNGEGKRDTQGYVDALQCPSLGF